MARFTFDQADEYGQSASGSFFQLKNDNDVAKVRFLYKTINDIEGYAVHQVDVGDKQRYVNCLRSYNEPVDKCPFCKAQYKVQPKLFLKLYNEDNGECQIWERGKTYFQRMAGLAAHYNPLCDEVIEVVRHGVKGDKQTSYEFFPVSNSPINIDDYEIAEPLGSIILDKNADEMNYYLDYGSFPEDGNSTQAPNVTRRTPSNTQGRRAF